MTIVGKSQLPPWPQQSYANNTTVYKLKLFTLFKITAKLQTLQNNSNVKLKNPTTR